jgi:uncharacterized protein YdeI (YjbR/CyaY-like superfamily)
MNPKVDFFFDKAGKWQKPVEALRSIVLDCGLTEELKWGVPAYTFDGRNIVLIHTFRDYCALLFFKGALLNDSSGVLIQQTRNVQAARQMRFTNLREVTKLKSTIKAYIYEAIEVERAGLKVQMKKTAEFEMPAEFRALLEKKKTLKAAFEKLTPGRQRGYLLHFSSARQAKTRIARIEKSIPDIIKGKGLND